MAQAPQAEHLLAGGQILFELDSFELAESDRLELSGRWFGVRGRRFVRPTLTLVGEDASSRALADLEHKPWTAEDGESWTAAFPVQPGGGAVREVELAVAPDIAVTLAPPLPLRPRGPDRSGGGTPRRRARRASPGGSNDPNGAIVAAHGGSAANGGPRPATRRELEHVNARLEDERREVARLREELAQTNATKAQISSALSRRDAAVRKFEAIVRERDEAVAERNRALAERADALLERDSAQGALDEALHGRRAAEREAKQARLECAGALRERQSIVGALERTRAERDQAVSARGDALARLEEVQRAANAQIAQLRGELAQERAFRERPTGEQAAVGPTAAERAVGPTAAERAVGPTAAERAVGPARAARPAREPAPRPRPSIPALSPPTPAPLAADIGAPAAPRRTAAHGARAHIRAQARPATSTWLTRVIALTVLIVAVVAVLSIVHSP